MSESNDVQRLRAERDALEQRVEELEGRPERRRRLAKVTAAICLILAVVLFAVAVPAAWARRTVLDTDRYVATVGPLAQDAAVQEYLARTVTEQLFTALQVQERLAASLEKRQPRIAFLAAPITNGVESFVKDRLQEVFASEAFAASWEQANRFAHAQLIAALEGGGDTLQVEGGEVVLNLLPLVNEALQAMSGVVTNVVGHSVTIPPISGDEIPSEAVTKVEAALGIDLPDGFGTIVVFDADSLAAVQRAVDLASRAVVLVVLVFLVFAALALWISPRKRRSLIQLATALLVVLVVERRFAIAQGNAIVAKAKPENQAAARAVVDDVIGALLRYTGWLLVFAILVLLVALVTGPYPWAVRSRAWIASLSSAAVGAVHERRVDSTVVWVAAHRDALMLGGAFVGVLLLLVADLSIWGFTVLLVLFALYEVALYRAAASIE